MNNSVAKTDANPFTLLQDAIARGVDTAQLEKLMDLQDRYSKGQAESAYNAAMNACQQEMPVVVKQALDTHKNKKYAALEHVNQAIRPVYSRHGFSLSFGPDLSQPKEGYVRVYCDVRHIGGHKERHVGDFALDGAGMKGGSNMTPIQGMGSSITYARRYLTLMIFNISVVDEDTDGKSVELIPIGPEQVEELESLIVERDVNRQKFLEFVNVKSLEDLPSRDFTKARNALHRKPKKAGAK